MDQPGRLDPVARRHRDVHHDQVGVPLADQLDRLVAGCRAPDDGEARSSSRIDWISSARWSSSSARTTRSGRFGTPGSLTERPVRCGGDHRRAQRSRAPGLARRGAPAHRSRGGGRAGFAGGFFALYVPGGPVELPARAPYSVPLGDPVPFEEARRIAGELAATLEGLDVTIVRRVDDVEPGRVNAIMHLEGAEPLAPDLSDLEGWYDRGLRSVGIVWSRPNALRRRRPVPLSVVPDTGPGLTEAGVSLVHACNLLGILVDLSHLNEAGFWDVARITQAPLVATHSNAHALCAVDAEPDRPPARRDRRVGRRRRRQLRGRLPARGRPS